MRKNPGSKLCRCTLFILLTLAATGLCGAQEAETAPVSKGDNASMILWGRERDGLQAGAYLLNSTGWLQSGDPIVVQFVLRNISDSETTVIIQSFHDTHPILGENNRMNQTQLRASVMAFLFPFRSVTRRHGHNRLSMNRWTRPRVFTGASQSED